MEDVSERIWRCRDHAFPLGARTLVMGVVNVTPDSFSDGGLFADVEDAVAHGPRAGRRRRRHRRRRAGSRPVPAPNRSHVDEELAPGRAGDRGAARRATRTLVLSVDTRHSLVANEAVAAGAAIVNDISRGLGSARCSSVVRDAGAGSRADAHAGRAAHDAGSTRTTTMSSRRCTSSCASASRRRCSPASPSEHLCVDPGIGFGKTSNTTSRCCARSIASAISTSR